MSEPRRRLAVIYQRPVEDPFSGGSTHLRGFVSRLRQYHDVEYVAPLERSHPGLVRKDTLLTSVRNIILANLRALAFVVHEARKKRASRVDAILLFDIYAAVFPFLWAKISSRPVGYYVQGLGRVVAAAFREQGYRGAWLLSSLRLPFERILLDESDLVLTVSSEMSRELVRTGVEPSRLMLCPIKRSLPTLDPVAVSRWQDRLGTRDRVGVVFVGNLNYPPNRRAAEFIAGRLRSELRGVGDGAVVVLVGLGSEGFASEELPRMVGTGPVVDLDSLLFACDIGIAPVEVGGGTSGKLVDYLLHGLRVVSTPAVSEGIVGGDAITIAGLEGFAGQLAQVISSVEPRGQGFQRAVTTVAADEYLGDSEIASVAARISIEIDYRTRGGSDQTQLL